MRDNSIALHSKFLRGACCLTHVVREGCSAFGASSLRIFRVGLCFLPQFVCDARHLLGLGPQEMPLELLHVVLQRAQRLGQVPVLGDKVRVFGCERLVAFLPLAVVFAPRHRSAEIKL